MAFKSKNNKDYKCSRKINKFCYSIIFLFLTFYSKIIENSEISLSDFSIKKIKNDHNFKLDFFEFTEKIFYSNEKNILNRISYIDFKSLCPEDLKKISNNYESIKIIKYKNGEIFLEKSYKDFSKNELLNLISEEICYKISKILNFGVVPKTYFFKIKNKIFSRQLFVKNAIELSCDDYFMLNKIDNNLLLETIIFTFIFGLFDRCYSSNLLYLINNNILIPIMIDNENFFDKKYFHYLESKKFFDINFLEKFNKKILILNLKKNKFFEFSSTKEFENFNFENFYDDLNEKYNFITDLFDEINYKKFQNKNFNANFIKLIIDENGKIYQDFYFLDNLLLHVNKKFFSFLDENFLKNFEKEFLLKTISKIKKINKTFLLNLLKSYELNYSLDKNIINETIDSILERKNFIIKQLEAFFKNKIIF